MFLNGSSFGIDLGDGIVPTRLKRGVCFTLLLLKIAVIIFHCLTFNIES